MANSTTIYRGQDNRAWVDVTLNKTLTLADNGIVQNVVADGITVTLPSTTAGAYFIVRNGGTQVTSGGARGAVSDGSVLVTVAPNAIDQIAGLGFTAADNKAALNTKATSRVGDQMTFVGDGTNGWNVGPTNGTWVRQT